jgi:hypothetical protein
VVQVEGGPIGLWNNRPKTEKVKKGDLVVKVRKAGQSDGKWVESDEKMMFEILSSGGIVELEIRRGLSEAVPQQPPSNEVVVDAGVEAPAAQELVEEMAIGAASADGPAVSSSGEAIVEVAELDLLKIEAKSTVVETTEVEPSSTRGGCRFFC